MMTNCCLTRYLFYCNTAPENSFPVCSLLLKQAKKAALPAMFLMQAHSLTAQEIFIHQRSNLVMNGTVSLVVNNAAFRNDGVFKESNSTVKFSGHKDTLTSYVSGTSATRFNNLTISKTAFGTALKSTVGVVNTLGVYGGNLYADSNLTLLSDASLTARVDVIPSGSDIIGKAKVERYLPSRRAWRLLTGPVTAATSILNSWQNGGIYGAGKGLLVSGPGASGSSGNGLDVSPLNNVSMKKWDNVNQQYQNVLNTKVPLSAGSSGTADNTGYFIFVRGDRDVNNFNIPNTNVTTITSIGKLQTGTQIFPAASLKDKYTLIGNPFASPVDFNNVVLTNVIKRFYVWDPNLNILGGFVMLDDLLNTGTYSRSPSGYSGGQTKDIQSSQAFFVQTQANGTASVQISETSKSAAYVGNVFRPMEPAGFTGATNSFRANLYLKEADGTTVFADGNLAQFNDFFNDSVQSEDAVKFININENIAFVRHGIGLSAERRPLINTTDTLFLKLWKTTQRAYQFEFVPENFNDLHLSGYLEDRYLNTSSTIDLSAITRIDFAVDANAASAADDRFRIVFKQHPLAPLQVTLTKVSAYPKNDGIAVEWNAENEINILRYEIEKSADGIHFEWVNTTGIKAGNNNTNHYDWLDGQPMAGDNFYRIKIYGKNGQTGYSDTVKISMGVKNNAITVYPNPIKSNKISLWINDMPPGNYHLTLSNNVGQVFYTGSIENNGSVKYMIKVGNKLLAGIYYLQVSGPEKLQQTLKIIVE